MNDNEANSSEYIVLKNLLSSWNLECLMTFFMDEGITIDVLQMLKPHHIPVLLRNYKFGTQIRFEHFLENWRRNINRPLSTNTNSPIQYCNCKQDTKEIISQTGPITRTISTQFPPEELPCLQITNPNVTTISHSLPSSPSHSPTMFETRPPPKLTPAPVIPATTAINKPEAVNPSPAMPPEEVTPNTKLPVQRSSGSKNSNSKFHNYKADDMYLMPHINVKMILQSHPKGIQILQYYAEHKMLTNAHRFMLINLVATFFDDHNYHLSLKTSYNMERDILELFPNEQLEYYRTEKRGKIYVKFCNMKRYKIIRVKSSKRKKRVASIDFASSLENTVPLAPDVMANMVEDEFSMNFDNWTAETAHPLEVYVKTENLNDEDYT